MQTAELEWRSTMRNDDVYRKISEQTIYLVWICWWRVLFARWRHDDAAVIFSALMVNLQMNSTVVPILSTSPRLFYFIFLLWSSALFTTASSLLLWISSLIRSELHWAYLLSLSCCCLQWCWAALQLQALLQPPTFFVVVSNGVECFFSTQSGCFSFDCCRCCCCFHKLFILSWQWNKREQRAQKKEYPSTYKK